MFRCYARIATLVLLGLSSCLLHAADQAPAQPPAEGKAIILSTAYGTTFDAYVAGPEDAKRGILIIHDRRGLGEQARNWADRFAGLGYRALAIDLYDGRYSNDPMLATRIMTSIDQEAANADLKAGLDYLKAPGRKIATFGWDYGGGQALWAALQDPEAVAATVIYYGPLGTNRKVLRTLSMSTSVLGIFGKRDAWISPAKVSAFEDAMREAGVPLTVAQFDADHGFTNPASKSYSKVLADEAWQKTEDFLSRHLE
ncbi:MAG: dienelactone hydrolase family protein [Gammaproteobacteria bacterium]|nr:dienelactone hydrolase family protein [Gammaproteobacteria bacterium]